MRRVGDVLFIIGMIALEIFCIGFAYAERGTFRVGGEWLVFPMGLGIKLFAEEVIYTVMDMLSTEEEEDAEESDNQHCNEVRRRRA